VASYLVVLLVLAALLVIGAARTLLSWRRVRGRLKFTNEYLSRYKKLLESYIPRGPNATLDEAEYDWLTARVNRMQRELGGRGVAASYKPPSLNIAYPNYAMLTNTLPQLGVGKAHHHDYMWCRDALLAHAGDLEHEEREGFKRLFNPLIWLTEGSRAVVQLPLWMARQSGLLGSTRYARAADSRLTRVLAFVLAFAAFAASLVEIIAGWAEVMAALRKLL
jgi:hypothetical protein